MKEDERRDDEDDEFEREERQRRRMEEQIGGSTTFTTIVGRNSCSADERYGRVEESRERGEAGTDAEDDRRVVQK